MSLYPGPTTLFQSKKFVVLTAACLVALLAAPLASAQTYSVVWYFTISGGNGAYPYAATVDRFGNLYAPTASGGFNNNQACMLVGSCGTVWKFYNHGSGWVGDELYEFMGGADGSVPVSPLTVAPSGIVYGSSYTQGGGYFFYQLRPPLTRPPSAVYFWGETTLSTTVIPSGSLTFDANGNMYGTSGDIVFEGSPSQGGWTFTTLYTFQGGDDGAAPTFGVLLDPAGNLYGATGLGGSANCGTVFELSNNGSGWTKTTLYQFQGGNDGCQPAGPLTRDSAGNLYGPTNPPIGGTGSVYELSPQNGGWTFSVLKSFTNSGAAGSLALDNAGDIYGIGTLGVGNIFKLTPAGGSWTYTSEHDFCTSDNACLPEGLAIDSHGNLFGATQIGGPTNRLCQSGCGTIWEFTP